MPYSTRRKCGQDEALAELPDAPSSRADLGADAPHQLAKGVSVQAKYGAKEYGSFAGRWYTGKVIESHDNGTYDILYDDGDKESHVPLKFIKVPDAHAAELAPGGMLPVAADIGRRLQVYWESEGEWFPGVFAAIEAGHDDGADTGDYHVIYDDGDEQWEPLGSRTPFRWSGDRLPSAPSHGSSSGEALSPPGRAPPRPKRALSERSHLIALPEAKASSCSNSNVEIDLQ